MISLLNRFGGVGKTLRQVRPCVIIKYGSDLFGSERSGSEGKSTPSTEITI